MSQILLKVERASLWAISTDACTKNGSSSAVEATNDNRSTSEAVAMDAMQVDRPADAGGTGAGSDGGTGVDGHNTGMDVDGGVVGMSNFVLIVMVVKLSYTATFFEFQITFLIHISNPTSLKISPALIFLQCCRRLNGAHERDVGGLSLQGRGRYTCDG